MTKLSKLIQQQLFPISEKETNLQMWWNISYNFNTFDIYWYFICNTKYNTYEILQ